MSLETFARNDHPSLGVEVELALVDERNSALTSGFDAVVGRLPRWVEGRVKPEFLKCYVELNTRVCRDLGDLEDDLSRSIRAVESAAADAGLGLFWGGTHPFSRWRDQEISPDPRYLELLEEYQEVVRRPVTFGLHVHVGVASGDAAIAAMNRLAGRLPLLLAISANSPFWQGRATGLHAHRIDVLEGIPTGGLPPSLRDWSEYRELVESFTRSGFIRSTKELWWDVRPNPTYGTVEVRICDMPADLPTALAIAALVQCLVAAPGGTPAEYVRPSEAQGLAIRQNRWLAARYGLDARLADPETGDPSSARDQARQVVDHLMRTAESLGCPADLARIADLAGRPTGSQRQLGLFEETRDLAEVVRRMVASSRLVPVRSRGRDAWAAPSAAPAAFGLTPSRT